MNLRSCRPRLPARCAVLTLVTALASCSGSPGVAPRRSAAAARALADAGPLADSLGLATERHDHAGAVRFASGRFARLEPVLSSLDPEFVGALVDLGAAHRSCGLFERSERELRWAATLADSLPTPAIATRARTSLELGLLLKDTGGGPEARARFERAWREIQPAARSRASLVSAIAQALGHWQLRWGRTDVALRWFERARALAESANDMREPERAEAETWTGFARLRAGRHDRAEPCFRRAIARLTPAHGADPPAIRSALDLLAVVEEVRGHHAAAESLLRRSTRLADQEIVHLPPGLGLGVSHPSLRPVFVDLLLTRGHPTEAWEESQVWSGWVTDAILGTASERARATRAEPETTAVLADRLRALDARLRTEEPRRAGHAGLALIAERARVEAALFDPRSFVPAGPEPHTPVLAALQRVLAPDEALIGWMQASWDDDARRGGRHAVWGYVVRHTGPVHWVALGQWRRQADFLAWGRDLDVFRQRLEGTAGWGLRVPADPALDTLGTRVHEKLVTPLLPELAGARRIVAVYQILNRWIPLECLRGPDGRLLAERCEIAYTPSARTFVALRDRARSPSGAGMRALVLGDPDYAGRGSAAGTGSEEPIVDWTRASLSALQPTVVRGVLAGARSVASLPPLPQSRAEARAVAAHFPGATLLLGERASAAELERLRADGRLSRYTLIHLATHALVDESFPERSAIALAPAPPGRGGDARLVPSGSDGLLRADDVLGRWRLGADLVVLSSCQTAGGRFTWSAQSLGLAQSFLGAGARGLVLSPWKVDDLATRALMQAFGERLADRAHPCSAARALQQARLALRDFRAPDGSRPFAHPAYWAGFILVGDPGGEQQPAARATASVRAARAGGPTAEPRHGGR